MVSVVSLLSMLIKQQLPDKEDQPRFVDLRCCRHPTVRDLQTAEIKK